MGVTGLYSYLKCDPSASQAFYVTKAVADHSSSSSSIRNINTSGINEPHKRYLIFDGNGLFHKLYFELKSTSRSLGGESTEFHEQIKVYFTRLLSLNASSSSSSSSSSSYQEEQISIRVIYDGAHSNKEAKHGTRVDRTKERRERVKMFKSLIESSSSNANSSTIRLGLTEDTEELLQVPSIAFMIFQQTLTALGITQWTSDGESDEHIAAVALHIQQEDPHCIVDILGEDSDFMIFEMAQSKTIDTTSSKRDHGGYVPLDTLQFDLDQRTSECRGISYRRYTTTSILAALNIPACLLPTLACLIGNDSALELDSFHAYLRSPDFLALLERSNMSLPPSMTRKSKGYSSNPDAIKRNGGFQHSGQLIEMTLWYVRCVTKILLGETALKIDNNYEAMMKDIKSRLFVRHSSSASSLSTVEQDLDHPHVLFTTAQKKYCLKRFFTPLIKDSLQIDRGFNIFDPGFEIVTDDEVTDDGDIASDAHEEKKGYEHKNTEAFSTSSSSSSTTLLLSSSFLQLYHSAHFSPTLLSIRLTRFYRAYVSSGHALRECVVHGRRWNQCRSNGSHIVKNQTCECKTADQCLSGLRRRVYERMFSIREIRPKRITSAASSSSSVVSTTAPSATASSSSSSPIIICEQISIISPNSSSSGEISSQGSVEMSIKPSVSTAAAEDNVLEAYSKMFPELFTSSATSWSTLFSILDVVPDLMLPSSSAFAWSSQQQRITTLAQSMQNLAVVHQQPSFISLAMVYRTVFLHTLQSVLLLGGNLEVVDASVQEELNRAVVGVNGLIALFAITYCKAVEKATASSSRATATSEPMTAPATTSAAPRRSNRQDIRSQDGPPTTTSATSSRATSSPFNNNKNFKRGDHASHGARRSDDDRKPAGPIPTVTMNLDCIPIAQLFSDTYQWTMYALHTVRCEEYLKSDSSSPSKVPPLPSLPLVPLFYVFNGSSFHQYYTRISDGLIHSRVHVPVEAAASAAMDVRSEQPPRRLGAGNGIIRGRGGLASRVMYSSARPTPSPTSSSSSSPSSSSTKPSLIPPDLLISFSAVDSFTQLQCLQLLRDESSTSTSSSPSSLHSSMVSVYIAMKRAVWSSIGLKCPEFTSADKVVAEGRIPNIPSISITNGSTIPRTRLPHETMSSSTLATESHSATIASSSLHHNFSFCTSPTPPLQVTTTSTASSSTSPSSSSTPVSSSPTVQTCKFCGWLPHHANGATTSGEEDDTEEEKEQKQIEDRTSTGTKDNKGKKTQAQRGKKQGKQ